MFCTIYLGFHKMLDLLSKFERALLCLCFAAMVVLACLQIFLRIFLNSGMVWADSFLRYLVLWGGMMGAVVATERNKHIAIDLASYLFHAESKPWLGVITHTFSLLVCCALTFASYIFVLNESDFGGAMILGIPSWALNMIFPLSFALISLRFFSAALDDVMTIAGKTCPYF